MDKTSTITNGKTIAQVESEMKSAVERLYIESWKKGISVAYFDENEILHLANPDGSDDLAEFNPETKEFKILSRFSEPGKGRFAYLLAS
ncbi:MAG: xenobiotic reductase B [Bacteroidales bacterium]|nr:xenobiotic reductase B [Bacteroidales bacterium]